MSRQRQTRRPNQTGSEPFAERGPDGEVRRWRVNIRLGPDHNGRPLRKWLSAPTKREVLAKREEFLRAVRAGERPSTTTGTLNELFDRWLAFRRASAQAGHGSMLTVQSYEQIVRTYLRSCVGRMKLNQLHPETVSLALLDLGQERSLSRGTMRTIHKVLKTCLNQGVRWRILSPAEADIGPCPLPDQERETIQALDTDQITQLIGALRGDQYEVLFLTALLSGLRTEELFGLTWNNLRGEVIEVRQALQYHDGHPVIVNQLKTVKARRDVSIPAQLAGRLLEYQRTREEELRRRAPTKWDQMGLIFLSRDGTPLRHSNVRRRLQRILARAGLPMISTYGLRHSYATASLILGVDRHVVMESMGHSTPVMTMRYETVVQKLRDDAARALDRAFDLDPP